MVAGTRAMVVITATERDSRYEKKRSAAASRIAAFARPVRHSLCRRGFAESTSHSLIDINLRSKSYTQWPITTVRA